jgi:hypothetical protein
MTLTSLSKDRTTSDRNRSSPNPGTAARPNTRRNGPPSPIEEQQDIKDSLEGRKFLEKHSLMCPPGEPPSHSLLSTCLHQISALAGVPKQALNAIRSVAFLLEEMEDTQINTSLREALDVQMTEFTSDFKLLISDAKEKIDEHVKLAEERLAKAPAPLPTQSRTPTNSYASALINPPAHANPRVAAREGIKARQFLIQGLKESKFSHLDSFQLKTELNKILPEVGLLTGKIRSVVNTRSGGTVIEADTDEVANWLSSSANQGRICDRLGAKAEFRGRNYNVIVFNVPLAINPEEEGHRLEICETNGLEPTTIVSAKWAKAVNKRNLNQRTAHLLLTFDDANAANRVITNGLLICNRKCQVERTRREPTRCLKCQGWNHFARDCIEDKDTCGNCAGSHRTSGCTVGEKACVSCKSKDHASWSRTCPAFTKRLAEFNVRNPDNSLQYFPTSDVWTWSTADKPTVAAAPAAPAPSTQARPSKIQLAKRPQQHRQQCDSYIPDYSTRFARSTLANLAEGNEWDDSAAPSRMKSSNQATTSTQPSRTSNSIAISNANPSIPNA